MQQTALFESQIILLLFSSLPSIDIEIGNMILAYFRYFDSHFEVRQLLKLSFD